MRIRNRVLGERNRSLFIVQFREKVRKKKEGKEETLDRLFLRGRNFCNTNLNQVGILVPIRGVEFI